LIAHRQEDGVDILALARPPVNALDLEAILACEAAFARCAATPPMLGVVLTGEGAAFSAGVDVRAWAGYDRAARERMVLAITRMTAALLSIPTPVVAAINGHALGGGLVLALCCDWRVVADDPAIRLGIPEAQAGVPFPVGPRRIIAHELPAPLLRRLALASKTLASRAMIDAGVLDEACAREALMQTARAAVQRLAGQPGFAAVKQQVRGGLADDVRALAAAGVDPDMDAFA
jgi:enoyl-CoA hydratase